MSEDVTAAAWAATEVAAVRDDAHARTALLARTYRAGAPRQLPYRRAAMSFMRWQANRGVLEPPSAPRPGSPWWRAVNERLLHDGCESVALADGLRGRPSSPTVELWLAFIAAPTAARWYRAHNASIVAAYLEHPALASVESRTERFFLNVVLMRVLYAHALVADPRLALGRLAPVGRLLGDPRLGMAGAFISLGRVLPAHYPITGDLDVHVAGEHGFGRLLDRAVIAPRMRALYDWSAAELDHPGLRDLINDGSPAYAWPPAEHHVWLFPSRSLPERLLGRVTASR